MWDLALLVTLASLLLCLNQTRIWLDTTWCLCCLDLLLWCRVTPSGLLQLGCRATGRNIDMILRRRSRLARSDSDMVLRRRGSLSWSDIDLILSDSWTQSNLDLILWNRLSVLLKAHLFRQRIVGVMVRLEHGWLRG